MLAICAADMPVVFKAPKTTSKAESVSQGIKPGAKPEHKKLSTSSKQPSVSSKEAIKEDQQATGGPTFLGVTSEARANPQLNNGTDPLVLVDQTKSVSEGLETILTQPRIGKRAISIARWYVYNMSRDVLTVGSTMRIPLLYRGEYSQWVERFMNYLEEQTDGEAIINSIKNGDKPLPRVTQVSIDGTTSTEQPPLKDKSMWSNQEKRIQKIDRLKVKVKDYEYYKTTMLLAKNDKGEQVLLAEDQAVIRTKR
nr:hypothetical protein [Tanacetum cinerariifolium]